jgi:hypothetical protein
VLSHQSMKQSLNPPFSDPLLRPLSIVLRGPGCDQRLEGSFVKEARTLPSCRALRISRLVWISTSPGFEALVRGTVSSNTVYVPPFRAFSGACGRVLQHHFLRVASNPQQDEVQKTTGFLSVRDAGALQIYHDDGRYQPINSSWMRLRREEGKVVAWAPVLSWRVEGLHNPG